MQGQRWACISAYRVLRGQDDCHGRKHAGSFLCVAVCNNMITNLVQRHLV